MDRLRGYRRLRRSLGVFVVLQLQLVQLLEDRSRLRHDDIEHHVFAVVVHSGVTDLVHPVIDAGPMIRPRLRVVDRVQVLFLDLTNDLADLELAHLFLDLRDRPVHEILGVGPRDAL